MQVVIAGAGQVGRYLAQHFAEHRVDVVLVDADEAALAEVSESVDAMTLRGDATHRGLLRQARVHHADLFVAAMASDSGNLVAAALARSLGARKAFARVADPGFYAGAVGFETGVLGIDAVLSASRLAAAELHRLIRAVDCRYVRNFAGATLQVAMVEVSAISPAVERAPDELPDGGARIRGVQRDGILRVPAAVVRLEPGDLALLAGAPADLVPSIRAFLPEHAFGRAVVVGGGDCGQLVAQQLAGPRRRVALVELDRARAEALAVGLEGVHVVHGNATRIDLLQDLQVGSAVHLVAATREDDANLLAALLGAQLGARNTFSLVHAPGYAEVYRRIGVRDVVSRHESFAQTVLELFGHHAVRVSEPLPGSSHALVELALPEDLEPIALRDIPLPPQTLTVGVSAREAAHTATPGLRVGPTDRLLVATPRGLEASLEDAVEGLPRRAR